MSSAAAKRSETIRNDRLSIFDSSAINSQFCEIRMFAPY